MKKLANRIINMNIVLLYGITLVVYTSWLLLVVYFLDRYGIDFSQNVMTGSLHLGKNLDDETIDKLAIVVVPLLEEIVFRWLPYLIVITIFNVIIAIIRKGGRDVSVMKSIRMYGILTVTVVVCVIFGYVHGSIYNILIQGVLGLILSMFYLRNYFRRRRKGKKCYLQVMPLLSSYLFHLFHNTVWTRLLDLLF